MTKKHKIKLMSIIDSVRWDTPEQEIYKSINELLNTKIKRSKVNVQTNTNHK